MKAWGAKGWCHAAVVAQRTARGVGHPPAQTPAFQSVGDVTKVGTERARHPAWKEWALKLAVSSLLSPPLHHPQRAGMPSLGLWVHKVCVANPGWHKRIDTRLPLALASAVAVLQSARLWAPSPPPRSFSCPHVNGFTRWARKCSENARVTTYRAGKPLLALRPQDVLI